MKFIQIVLISYNRVFKYSFACSFLLISKNFVDIFIAVINTMLTSIMTWLIFAGIVCLSKMCVAPCLTLSFSNLLSVKSVRLSFQRIIQVAHNNSFVAALVRFLPRFSCLPYCVVGNFHMVWKSSSVSSCVLFPNLIWIFLSMILAVVFYLRKIMSV